MASDALGTSSLFEASQDSIVPLGRKQNTNLSRPEQPTAPGGKRVLAGNDEEKDGSDEEDRSTVSNLSVKVIAMQTEVV